MLEAVAAAQPDKYEVWVYQSNTGFKGSGTLGSFEGLKADMSGNQNSGKSGNSAKEGSFLVKILEEFPGEIQDTKQAHGSPFVWTEQMEGPKKKVTYLGGVDATIAWSKETFPDNAEVKAAGVIKMFNIFNNLTPGFTIPDPL